MMSADSVDVSRLALTLLARPPRDERADGGVRVAAAATRGGTETPDRAPTARRRRTHPRACPPFAPPIGRGGAVHHVVIVSARRRRGQVRGVRTKKARRRRPAHRVPSRVQQTRHARRPQVPDARVPRDLPTAHQRRRRGAGQEPVPTRAHALPRGTHRGARRGLRQQVHDGRHDRRGTTQDGPAVDRGTRRADALRGERNGAHRGSGARVRLSGEHRGRDPPRAQVTRVGVLHLQRPRHHRQAGHRARRGGSGPDRGPRRPPGRRHRRRHRRRSRHLHAVGALRR